MNSDLYKENILNHFRHPKNFGDLPGANAQSRESNVLCGDVVEMKLKIDHGRIVDIMFRGQGCAISQASASMLTVFSKGKTLNEVTRLQRKEII